MQKRFDVHKCWPAARRAAALAAARLPRPLPLLRGIVLTGKWKRCGGFAKVAAKGEEGAIKYLRRAAANGLPKAAAALRRLRLAP